MPVRLEKATPCKTRVKIIKYSWEAPEKAKTGVQMKDWQSLAHTTWDCKYHVVIVPKYRKKVFYGRTRKRIGAILRELCRYKGIEILEAHAMPDHIHMCISVPPKYSIAMTIGYLKGKSAIRIHKEMTKGGFTNKNFWARGYCVSTVGLDEAKIRAYIQNQEKLEMGEQGTLNF
jgi:putative transposase